MINISLTTLAGNIENLTYKSGGEFDVGLTITEQDGTVRGYGLGDMDYVLKGAMKFSPPEALIQLRNSRISTGLTYTAISWALIAVGLSALLNLLIKLLVK